MNIDRLIASGLSKGLEGLEVYLLESEETNISISNDKVKEVSSSNTYSMGIRGSMGKRTGIISVNDITLNQDALVERLFSIVKSSMEDPYWSGFPPPVSGFKTITCRDERIVTMDYDEKLSLIKDLMEAMKDEALRNGAVRTEIAEGVVRFAVQKIIIANSEGVFKQDDCTLASLFMVLKSATSQGESDKSFWITNRRLEYRELERLGRETGRLSTMFARNEKVDKGEYELIITPPVADLFIAFSLAPAFSALNVSEGRSPLKDKEGRLMFSDNVTIMDDPSMPLEVGSRAFDDEGMPTSPKFLVENGIVKNLLHNYYTFNRMKSGIYGNGFRRNPSTPPTPSPTNLVLRPGNKSLEEMMVEVNEGLVLYETIGYWMSNPVNGDVKATATHALVLKNGEIVGSAKGLLVTGNIYQWLGRLLKGLSKDTYTSDGVSAPGIWIEKAKVASE